MTAGTGGVRVVKGRWAAPAVAGVLVLGLGACEFAPTSGLTPSSESEGSSAGGQARTRARTATAPAAIPLRVITNRGATLVLVPLKVNGHGPYEFILDTGASTSTVDRRLVRRLGLPRTGQTARVTGVTGSAVVPVVRVTRWTLGGRPLRGRELTVTDIGDNRIAGLLGSDELRRFGAVTVDFQRERLVLRNK